MINNTTALMPWTTTTLTLNISNAIDKLIAGPRAVDLGVVEVWATELHHLTRTSLMVLAAPTKAMVRKPALPRIHAHTRLPPAAPMVPAILLSCRVAHDVLDRARCRHHQQYRQKMSVILAASATSLPHQHAKCMTTKLTREASAAHPRLALVTCVLVPEAQVAAMLNVNMRHHSEAVTGTTRSHHPRTGRTLATTSPPRLVSRPTPTTAMPAATERGAVGEAIE